jgi:hypothetical protein
MKSVVRMRSVSSGSNSVTMRACVLRRSGLNLRSWSPSIHLAILGSGSGALNVLSRAAAMAGGCALRERTLESGPCTRLSGPAPVRSRKVCPDYTDVMFECVACLPGQWEVPFRICRIERAEKCAVVFEGNRPPLHGTNAIVWLDLGVNQSRNPARDQP